MIALLLATSVAAPAPEFDAKGALVCPAAPIMGTYRLTADVPFTKSVYRYHYDLVINPTATCQDVLVTMRSRGETKDGKALTGPSFKGHAYVKGLRFDPKTGASAEMRITLQAGKTAKRHLYFRLHFDVNKQLTGTWSFDRETWTRDRQFHGTFSTKAKAGQPVAFDKLPQPSCQMTCAGQYGWAQSKPGAFVHQHPSNSYNQCRQSCSASPRP